MYTYIIIAYSITFIILLLLAAFSLYPYLALKSAAKQARIKAAYEANKVNHG